MRDFSYGKDIRLYGIGNWLLRRQGELAQQRVVLFRRARAGNVAVIVSNGVTLILREGLVYAYLIYMVMQQGLGWGDFTMYFATIAGFADWMKRNLDNMVQMRAEIVRVDDARNCIEMPDDDVAEPAAPPRRGHWASSSRMCRSPIPTAASKCSRT
jgi:ATP-binding cassette subfamily C protein